jgi:2-desacetyl-2-hydroxyethyl bacteriochlorophyllide A dehydrogenase
VRAVVFEGVGKVRVDHVPDATLEEPDDAIVRVTRTAICGSDLHFLHGKAPLSPGESMGHEAVGVVEAAGSDVAIPLGRRVVVAFNIACGRCWFCRAGQTQLCETFRNLGAGTFGGGLAGAQADLVRVPHADVNLLPVPDGVDDETALFVGDIATTGLYAASCAAIEAGDVVAVVGCGPLGFFTIQACRALGAERVIALDREPARLDLAARAGAETVNVDMRNPTMALAEVSGGRGADTVIEVVGTPQAFESAVSLVRRGGRVVVAGMYTGESVEVQLGVYWARALDVRFVGICPVHSYWERTMALVAEGSFDPGPLISHRLPLEDAPLGYELFAGHEATKVVLIP